jgi:hypothetical protein
LSDNGTGELPSPADEACVLPELTLQVTPTLNSDYPDFHTTSRDRLPAANTLDSISTSRLGMAIRKQEFYEGAALHRLARSGDITSLRYEPPLFILNDRILVLLKYSTRSRSPWGFTFMPEEQVLLAERARAETDQIIIGLICGADGVAAFRYEEYIQIARDTGKAIHISCYRYHREHYEVNGPDGTLARKIAPGDWQRVVTRNGQ